MGMAYKGATCRGSYALGTACGNCERCDEERIKMDAVKDRANVNVVEVDGVRYGPRSVAYMVDRIQRLERSLSNMVEDGDETDRKDAIALLWPSAR